MRRRIEEPPALSFHQWRSRMPVDGRRGGSWPIVGAAMVLGSTECPGCYLHHDSPSIGSIHSRGKSSLVAPGTWSRCVGRDVGGGGARRHDLVCLQPPSSPYIACSAIVANATFTVTAAATTDVDPVPIGNTSTAGITGSCLHHPRDGSGGPTPIVKFLVTVVSLLLGRRYSIDGVRSSGIEALLLVTAGCCR